MAPRVLAWATLALAGIVSQTLALHFDAAEAKNYPVSKVVALLNDMKVQLEKEQDADEEIYSNMACWCTTNDKGKTKSIADAEQRISQLGSTIEKMTALSLSLNAEIEGLTKEIAKNVKSLEVATALRAKQLAEFNEEEKEMIQSIAALKQAVIVLNKHQGGSAAAFLNNKVLLKAFATAKALADKHVSLLQGAITPSQKRIISSLAQDEGPTFKAYSSQSGQIFGILKQMQATFEADLSNSAKEEMASAEAYADLKVAKEEEIAAGQTSLDSKEQHLATTDETNAQAAEDKEDTEAALGADQKFLANLKRTCSESDAAWETRQKERLTELEAIAKAVSILSSDDSKDLFSKTFNFLQVSRGGQTRREKAAAALAKFPKLALLATSVRLDTFAAVKKAIDKMIVALEKESGEEVKHKDYCVEEFHTNEQDTQKKTHAKINLETKIEALKQSIKEHKAAIDVVIAEIAELNLQKKRAGENREAEHKEFEGVVADQRETQSLLNKALDVLKKVYGDGVVFAQTAQEPPAQMAEYKKSTGSTGVIMLISQIISDAKAMEEEAMHDEQTAQDSYVKFVKTTNESLKAKDDIKVDLNEQKAKAEKGLTQSNSELDGTMTELESLGDGAAALHKSCDYTLKNFDVRQEARDQEVDALRKAKAFLSGMKA